MWGIRVCDHRVTRVAGYQWAKLTWIKLVVPLLGVMSLTFGVAFAQGATRAPAVTPPVPPNGVIVPDQPPAPPAQSRSLPGEAPAQIEECQMYISTTRAGFSQMYHTADVGCTEATSIEVEECAYVQNVVSGKWYEISGSCRIGGPEVNTLVAAQLKRTCVIGVNYKTWGWDDIPGYEPSTVTGWSPTRRCST